jgi:HEPN domain-containing protein
MNPPRRKRFQMDPSEWLRHARSDLSLARLGRGSEVLPEQICFRAQQTVETALKAALIFHGVDFPLTHDLQELVEIFVAVEGQLPPELSEADTLTPYAVETRYPGFWGEVTEVDVDEALRVAEFAVGWAANRIGAD